MAEEDKVDIYSDLAIIIESDLSTRYGAKLTDEALLAVLGYQDMKSLLKAEFEQTLPVPIFFDETERRKYAVVKDVAQWLSKKLVDDHFYIEKQ